MARKCSNCKIIKDDILIFSCKHSICINCCKSSINKIICPICSEILDSIEKYKNIINSKLSLKISYLYDINIGDTVWWYNYGGNNWLFTKDQINFINENHLCYLQYKIESENYGNNINIPIAEPIDEYDSECDDSECDDSEYIDNNSKDTAIYSKENKDEENPWNIIKLKFKFFNTTIEKEYCLDFVHNIYYPTFYKDTWNFMSSFIYSSESDISKYKIKGIHGISFNNLEIN